MYVCKIVREMEDMNMPEGVGVLRSVGFENFYKGFLQDVSMESLKIFYLEALEIKDKKDL